MNQTLIKKISTDEYVSNVTHFLGHTKDLVLYLTKEKEKGKWFASSNEAEDFLAINLKNPELYRVVCE
jgi:hypothetical protein